MNHHRGERLAFDDLKLTRQFLNAVADAGYSSPTEIQLKAVPPILAGQDIVGIAQTGTGKTAAYLLPLLQQLKYAQDHAPRCLILAPTKELTIQIADAVKTFSTYTDLRHVALYGGIGPKAQIEKLEAGVDIIVATPGRFLELYAKGAIQPKMIKHIVLDECDRMMDMGFWPQLREIQEKIPQKKQQLLFSATFPKKVERIADNFMLFPVRIEVTPPATPAETVGQQLYAVPNRKTKLKLLSFLLQDTLHFLRVIIFTHTKKEAGDVVNDLKKNGISEIGVLHSNKAQNARINTVQQFSTGNLRILVSTDVSARGLDIQEVSHVINFNIPTHYDDYVHRIGRTGRAFKTGTAISFMDPSEAYHVAKIEQLIHQKLVPEPLPDAVQPQPTSFDEQQAQHREVDRQRRMEDPDFKGAFHEKKKPVGQSKKNPKKSAHPHRKNR